MARCSVRGCVSGAKQKCISMRAWDVALAVYCGACVLLIGGLLYQRTYSPTLLAPATTWPEPPTLSPVWLRFAELENWHARWSNAGAAAIISYLPGHDASHL